MFGPSRLDLLDKLLFRAEKSHCRRRRVVVGFLEKKMEANSVSDFLAAPGPADDAAGSCSSSMSDVDLRGENKSNPIDFLAPSLIDKR